MLSTKPSVLFTLLLALVVTTCPASAQGVKAAPAPTPATIGSPPATVSTTAGHAAVADGLIAKAFESQKLVAISVVVAKDGSAVYQQHIGFEDREAHVPAGAATMYRWASISKPVTATVTMMMLEAGKFELDADVRTLVPEFPAKPWVVTPRQLLGHLGGIVHYDNGKVVALPVPATPEHPYADVVKALDTFKESPLVCEPGTKYSYTTHGYMLLGACVERASGIRYWTLVKDWIVPGAEMTTFRPDYQWEKIEHRAVGYRKDAKGEMVKSTDTDVSWKLPGGGFISTVGDLSRFSSALMDGKLVRPETFALMRTPQTLKSGEKTGYGLGLSIGTLGDRATVSHAGAQEKSSTYLLMLPEEKLSVAIMSNTEGASLGQLAEAIAAEWLGVKVAASAGSLDKAAPKPVVPTPSPSDLVPVNTK